MAELNTKYFGTLSYDESEILHFQEGPFGFEENKSFLLIRFVNEDSSMLCLQSVEEEGLAFIVINPFHFMPDYSPRLSRADLESLQAEDEKNLLYYVICTIHEDLENSTANLKCPIVVNPEHTNSAKQVILEDADYSFKHFFSTMRKTEGSR